MPQAAAQSALLLLLLLAAGEGRRLVPAVELRYSRSCKGV
jgi:hypothetical protein